MTLLSPREDRKEHSRGSHTMPRCFIFRSHWKTILGEKWLKMRSGPSSNHILLTLIALCFARKVSADAMKLEVVSIDRRVESPGAIDPITFDRRTSGQKPIVISDSETLARVTDMLSSGQ